LMLKPRNFSPSPAPRGTWLRPLAVCLVVEHEGQVVQGYGHLRMLVTHQLRFTDSDSRSMVSASAKLSWLSSTSARSLREKAISGASLPDNSCTSRVPRDPRPRPRRACLFARGPLPGCGENQLRADAPARTTLRDRAKRLSGDDLSFVQLPRPQGDPKFVQRIDNGRIVLTQARSTSRRLSRDSYRPFVKCQFLVSLGEGRRPLFPPPLVW